VQKGAKFNKLVPSCKRPVCYIVNRGWHRPIWSCLLWSIGHLFQHSDCSDTIDVVLKVAFCKTCKGQNHSVARMGATFFPLNFRLSENFLAVGKTVFLLGSVCLSVCLSVCVQDKSKSAYQW